MSNDGKEELHSFCQNIKRERGESYFERYRNGSSPWFSEMKMNCRAFMSINCMRAGHSSLKACLNRFNIVSTADCECGDGLQTEDHIFWDSKLYEEHRATMVAILPENSKKEYPKLVTELVNIERKKELFKASGTSKTKFLNLFQKGKEVNVQNTVYS
jgi:hypothetical protein